MNTHILQLEHSLGHSNIISLNIGFGIEGNNYAITTYTVI